MTHAIVLAGGFGTRLQSVVADVPKPMAPINNKPFLAYLLSYLRQQGITRVTLSVHHKREVIQNYFGVNYQNMVINYVVEQEPLGTGGALAYALSEINTVEPVLVVNGDTWVDVDIAAFKTFHQQQQRPFSMVLVDMDDGHRYGNVVVDANRVTRFEAQGKQDACRINAGVYMVEPDVFKPYDLAAAFSLEQDFLMPYCQQLQPAAFCVDNRFIDIGVPSDFARAQTFLPEHISMVCQDEA